MKTGQSIQPAERLEKIEFSPIRIILERVREQKELGETIYSFCAGEPDFPTPQPIKEAVCQALLHDRTHYSSNRGVLELRKETAKRIKQDTGVSYEPESELLITTGAAEAIEHVMEAFVNPGDEIIIPTPAFMNYKYAAKLCGAEIVEVPMLPEEEYGLNVDRLKKAVTPKTRMIVLNNPCNPTGAVYEKEALQELCQFAANENLLLVSDEIYSTLTYEDSRFYSVAAFPGMKEQAIVINGFSKAYAMTGWRVGYLAASADKISSLLKVHQYTTTSGNTFVQEGLAAAVNLPETNRQTEEMRRCFAQRKRYIAEKLAHIEGMRFTPPRGAFYLLADISETGLTGEEFAEALLCQEKVAVVPAKGFGAGLDYCIRLSFSASDETIEEGMRRLKTFIRKIR